jgi:flagellar export protein FliJ
MGWLSQLRDEVKATREIWDAARQEYNLAATELEKLESLRSRASDEYRDEMRREVQKDLDETVLRKWSSPESLME